MPETPAALRGGELNAAISKAGVRSFSDYIGRRPTKARTSIRDDLVVCLLENGLTKAERSLLAGGREQLVFDTRSALQSTMRSDLVAAVERLTERKVVAFMSDNHIDPDVGTETFLLAPVLEPPAGDGVAENGARSELERRLRPRDRRGQTTLGFRPQALSAK